VSYDLLPGLLLALPSNSSMPYHVHYMYYCSTNVPGKGARVSGELTA